MSRLLLLALSWLVAVPWLLFPQVAPPLTLLSLLLLAGTRLWATGRWHWRPAATSLNGIVLVYLLLAGGAFLLTPVPAEAFSKLTTLILGVFGYLLVLDWLLNPAGIARNRQGDEATIPARLNILVLILALAGGGIALGSLLVVEWPQRQFWDLSFLTDHIPQISDSLSVHHNEVAGTLLFLLPFALYLVRRPVGKDAAWFRPGNDRWLQPLGWLLFIPMLLVLVLMQSRTALFSLAGMVLLFVVWGRWRLRWMLASVAIAGLLVLLFGALLNLSPAQVSSWVDEVDAVTKQGDFAPQSWPMRLEVWSTAGQMLLDYPAFGAGLDSFVQVSRGNYPFLAIPVNIDFAHAHNVGLQAGVDMGWPGLLITLLLLGLPFGGLWRVSRPADEVTRPLLRLFGVSLSGYIFFNLLDTISPLQRPGVLFWLILAGSATILTRTRKMVPWWERYLALAPIGLLLVLLVTPPAGQNRANWLLDRARLSGGNLPPLATLQGHRRCIWLAHRQQWPAAETCFADQPEGVVFSQSQGQWAEYAHDPAGALAWYDLALALDDTTPYTYFLRGQMFEKQEEIGRAQTEYEQAVHFAARQGWDNQLQAKFHFYLGRTYARQQFWLQALQQFQRAVELDDTQPIYCEALGDMLQVVGDTSGAAAAYKKAGEK